MTPRSTWILTEGLAGTEAPCRGLAAALGVEPVLKRVRVRQPWDALPGRLWLRPLSAPTRDSDRLAPPWPDLLISSGNVAAPLAVAIKRASGGRTCIVHIQNPKLPLGRFDLVTAPRHDGIEGPNVVVTRATLHGLTRAALAAEAEIWRPRLAGLPRPLVAVLVGGSNRRFKLDTARIHALARDLRRLMAEQGCGIVLTPSRRTGPDNTAVLAGELAVPGAFVWDGKPPNPYLGLLALADFILVTQDSVSMISEAIGTGKPVYWIGLDGRSRRLQRFVDTLTADGILRKFESGTRLEPWRYEPPDDTARVAAEIRRRFGW
ncbi:MAG: mitochondrial fission ELM1 family protein [Alphaproteobacteria bacterium]|nr:mitochondrial fission ELM1 family protein [Alphaproteobacteria bacterium]